MGDWSVSELAAPQFVFCILSTVIGWERKGPVKER